MPEPEAVNNMSKIINLCLLLAFILGIPTRGQENCPKSGRKPGEYSQLSVELCFQDWAKSQRHLEISSPDGTVELLVEGENARLQANGHPVGGPFRVTPDEEWIACQECAWLIEGQK